MGVSSSESEEAWTADPANVSGYALTGCCRAMFANRLSYTFDFKGEMRDSVLVSPLAYRIVFM